MANNRLILRKMISPWVTQHMDITRSTTLTHVELDSNFVYLKGEVITSASVDGNTLSLNKINGESIEVDIEGLSGDTGQTLSLINRVIGDLDNESLWESGSSGRKSIRRKNDTNIDSVGDYSLSQGLNTMASGDASHAEGINTNASGKGSHAEGFKSNSSGDISHAEGRDTNASGEASHAEGFNTNASGDFSHAEGSNTVASGLESHAEGDTTTASGVASHSGGRDTTASGDISFSHSNKSQAEGDYSAIVGGSGNFVESGGQSSGVYVGVGNKITGVDYAQLITKLETELETLTYNRTLEHEEYQEFIKQSKESLYNKNKLLDDLNVSISTLLSDISDINEKIKGLTSANPNDPKIGELNDLKTLKESELDLKNKEKASLEEEIDELYESIKTASDVEDAAMNQFEETRAIILKNIEQYRTLLLNSDNHPPIQSSIVAGEGNLISNSSNSIIGAGSENKLEIEVKNSGIFAGIENKINGDEYSDLIEDLQEELSSAIKVYNSELAKKQQEIKILSEELANKKFLLFEENKKENPDSNIINTLTLEISEIEDKIFELQNELKVLSDEHATFVKEMEEKIISLQNTNQNDKTAPVENSAIIAGKGNRIGALSDNSAIIAGKGNKINNLSGSVVIGGEGITAELDNTVYTPNLNIKVQPSRDNAVTQVLVRDSEGYVKYKDVSSFTDLSVVSGDYNVQTGVVTLTNNDGNSFDISGFSKNMTDSYTTNAYIEDGVMYFDNNVHGPKYYQVNVNELINVIIDRGDCSEEQYSQYLKLANEYESINDKKIKHEDELVKLEGDVSELYKLIDALKVQIDSLDPEQDADQIAKLVAQLKIYKNSVEEKLKLIAVSKDKIKLLSSNSILEFSAYMPVNESNFNCWARTQIINIIGYEDRGSCSSEKYNEYVKLANHYSLTKEEFDLLVIKDSELTIQITQIEDDISVIIKQISSIEKAIENTDNEELIAQLTKQLNAYKIQLEDFTAQLNKLQKESLSVKDVLERILKSEVLDFGAYMPINEVNFDCWSEQLIIDAVGYDERGACSEDDYNTYVKMGQKVLTENENIQTLQLELSENKRILKTYKDRIAELEAMPQPLPDDLQKELNVLIEDGYSLEAEIKRASEIIKNWLESDEYDFITQYMPINEVNFICWKHSQLLSIIEECCKDDVRGDCSDDKYSQYLKLANEYSTTKDLFDTTTETQTQLTILINEGVTTISEKEAQLLKLKKQLEDLLNSGGNPDLPFDVNLAISNIDELLVINTEYDINLGLWSNGIGSTEEDFNNRKSALLDSLNKMLEKSDELETLLHLTFGSPSYDTEYGIKEELKLHLQYIKGITNAGGSGTGILQAAIATVNAQTWTGDYSGLGDWGADIINPLIVQSMSTTSSIQSHLTNIKNKINATNANPGNGDNAELIAELQKQIASLTKELEDLTKVLDSNRTELVDVEMQLIDITNSGVLEFEAYMPINEVNFDCWSEQQIIDAVGYEDRGACSLKSYTEYTDEANNYKKIKKQYDELIKEQSESMTQVAQFKTDISDLKANISSLENLISNLDPDTDSEEIARLTKQLNAYRVELENFTAQLSQKENDLSRTNERIKVIEDSGELDFVAYMPINEVNFDCWTEAKLYNELNIKIESITNNVGYDERGDCSDDKYQKYLKLANQYDTVKKSYDDSKATEQQLSDDIINLEALIATSEESVSHKNDVKNTLDATKFDLEAEKARLQQVLEDLLNAPGEDLFEIEVANKLSKLLIAKIAQMGGVISQKTEQQTDVEFFTQYKESLLASVGDIDNLIDTLKKMMISEVTEDYVGKNAIETILNNILSELSKITQILGSDFSNDAYLRLVAHHSHLVELADELREGVSSVEFPPSDNSEAIADLEEQIKIITTQIASTNSQIVTITEEIVILDNEIIGYKVQLQTYKLDYSTAQENIRVIENSSILQFEVYMPINEVNFDCWSEQLIIDAVGYEDRGECSLNSYTEYISESKNYESAKEQYDTLIEEQSESMAQVAQFKTDIADLIAARASKQTELDRLKSEDPNSPLIPVLEEEIKQLDRDIEDFTAQLSQKEADLLRTNERIQIIIDSGDLDFVVYMPVNEVNFDCWTEAKLYNELNIKIESITNTVGYDDRGICSSDKYAVYLEEVAKYESKKSHYDSNIEERDSVKLVIEELESDIDTLETELIILNNDRLYKVSIGESIEELQKIISDKEAELSDKETNLSQNKVQYSSAIEEIKIIEDSSDLEFVAYMPANEINFDCWTEQQIIDVVGYGDRGDCSEELYEEYVNIIKTSNDFYNKSLVPPSSWEALDLPDSISYKDLSLYKNKSVEFRNNQVLEFNQTLALYDSELTKYQAILDPLKVIENPTEEQLAEINGLEKIIKLLNDNREKLISDNNTDEKLYIELTKWFSDNIDYWNNSEYKVMLETYGPVNEANFNCYINSLQNDKIDKLIEDNEYKIYNIESQLNNSSLDNEGTFNYYPNVYDDFSGNPKFSVGNFDELDSIINLSSNDLVTWGKLVCNGGVGGAIIKNLFTSIRCIESLENEIISIEAEETNDFNNLKNIYETEIQNLRSQQQSDPRLTTDLLEVKLSNMINERSVNSDLNAYMVDKLREVLKVYKQVNAIADDFCNGGVGA